MKSLWPVIWCLALICACGTSRLDHFYVLTPQPAAVSPAPQAPRTRVALKVILPSVVDRPEMVLNTSAEGVTVLEHERWAAPLPDLVSQALARDLERRRSDLMVVDRSFDRPDSLSIKITVELVQLSLRQSGSASIEAHWRIIDPRAGTDWVEGSVFETPLRNGGYASVAQALSECLGLLADKLAAKLPAA
ncbi:MAG: PqiC family protein [Pseudomonadota bacterium]|nr:PqiC family protein [Pseudomonadota bacterium]